MYNHIPSNHTMFVKLSFTLPPLLHAAKTTVKAQLGFYK